MKLIIGLLIAVSLLLIPASVQAGDPPRLYFRFTIPTGVKYSPGWFGRSDYCPKDVVTLYFNDKDLYGIAYTTDKFIPKEAQLLTKETAEAIVNGARDEKDIYFGQKLSDRWIPEISVQPIDVVKRYDNTITMKYSADVISPQLQTKEVLDAKVSTGYDYVDGQLIQKKAIYCPVCGVFIGWYDSFPMTSRYVITCSNGHRIATYTYDNAPEFKTVEVGK